MPPQTGYHCITLSDMSLNEDRNWAAKIYQERASGIDADQKRYLLFSQRLSGELEMGRRCSLRTTVRGRQSTQDIALFIYRDFAADLFGPGLGVVSFNTGGDLAKEFADAWSQKVDAFMNESLSNKADN